jgi:hypothetical protein
MKNLRDESRRVSYTLAALEIAPKIATGPKFREELPFTAAGGGDPKLNFAVNDRIALGKISF